MTENTLALKIFENENFGKIRTAIIDGKVYFCGLDVAKALGYKRERDAIAQHCKGAVKHRTLTDGGEQTLTFIPEGDVYRLITHSKLPAAEQFESWIFDEVIPTIRQTGIYATDQVIDKILSDPDFGITLLTQLKESRQEAAKAKAELAEAQPKVEYFDEVLQSESLMTTTSVAKDFGWSAVQLNRYLESKGVQYKQGGRWYLKQKYSEMGLAQSKTHKYQHHDGNVETETYLCWTEKGREMIYRMLKEDGIEPEVVRERSEKVVQNS